MSFPLTDWQFWVATVLVLGVAAYGASRLVSARRRSRARKVTLTIGGQARDSRRSRRR